MFLLTLLACRSETPVSVPVAPALAPPPTPSAAVDPESPAVAYRLAFPEASGQRVQVEAAVRCPDAGVLAWWMPVWTPGSYLVREYARHVEQLEGFGSQGAIAVAKVSKNRWRMTCDPGDAVGIRYRLYAGTLSVRDSFVDAEMGVLNGAATFVLPDVDPEGPLDVSFALSDGWSHIETALPPHPNGDPHRFLAPDVDTLLDSPVVMGNPDVRTFEIQGVPHRVVTLGALGPWDPAGAAADIEQLAREITAFWGQIPYGEYRFLNVLAERRGGLEHLDSTLMMTSRWNRSLRADRQRWLGLVSHEFFHAWNVKRLRPVGLGPFDYEHEAYTRSLWIAEGITSYYDDLLLVRAGFMTEDDYLQILGRLVARIQDRPGRAVQSLGDASFDSWIKYSQRDENTANQTISYYAKGAVVGWLLDAELRRATRDRSSLDDLMRLAWVRHGADGYDADGFRVLASELAGRDMGSFFDGYVDGTRELDFGGALHWWGLRFRPASTDAEDADGDRTPGWLGVDPSTGGGVVITEVLRDTPAWEAGLAVGDEIIAIDDARVTAGNLTTRMAQLGSGYHGSLLVARRGQLVRLPVVLGAQPQDRWSVQVDPGASPIAARRRAAWLSTP